MENKVSQADASEFIRKLLEWTGGFKVQDDMRIVSNDGQIIKCDDKDVIIFSEKMDASGKVILSPFCENINEGKQTVWFWEMQTVTICAMLDVILSMAVDFKSTNTEEDFVKMELASILKGGDPLKKSLKKIPSTDILDIFYSKKTKTAQIQSKLFDDDFLKGYDITNKKHIEAIRKCFLTIFKADSFEEFNALYRFTSELVSIPSVEAKLRVLKKTLDALKKYVKAFLEFDINTDFFDKHLPHIRQYHILTMWANEPVAIKEVPEIPKTPTTSIPAWKKPIVEVQQQQPYQTPMNKWQAAAASHKGFTGYGMPQAPQSPFGQQQQPTTGFYQQPQVGGILGNGQGIIYR